MRFKDRTVLVTGGGRGIGRAIAVGFAAEGASVAINAAHLESAEEAAVEARAFGGRVLPIEGDVSIEADVQAMVDRVLVEFGHIDVLINNAGISQPLVPLIEQDTADFDRVIAINLRGTYLCCKAVARGMIERRYGKIVNIGSITAHTGPPMRTAYAPSKAAVVNLTMALGVEMAKHDINVNSISPGYVLTDLVRNFVSQGKVNEDAVLRRTPLGRMSSTEDIAKAALFLASDDARNITGTDLLVDAGWTANGYYM